MRKGGLLIAVSSLPNRHGVGDFGPSAYEFVRQLKKTKMTMWQVLPLNPLGYGNSPYQPYSSKAMDEIYISLDLLTKEGLIGKTPSFNSKTKRVDYDAVRAFKTPFLRQAYATYKPNKEYRDFLASNQWLRTYAIFLTLKKKNNLNLWTEWPLEEKNWIKDHKYDISPLENDISYEMFLQYLLFKQWSSLKSYANKQGIVLVGDIPIYVGIDSDDCWDNQKQFLLNPDGTPTHIAGVPPDYFSKTGQRWGNPLFNWKVMKDDGFKFWLSRLSYNAKLFDYIRIDHFRAFDTYWKIPASCPTAEKGEWVEAPGYALFDTIFAQYPNLKILAEDLGDLRPQVLELRDHYKFPGMKIVQFTIDPEEEQKRLLGTFKIVPERENMIIYPGTHDNQTTRGWYLKLDKKKRSKLVKLLAKKGYSNKNVVASLNELTFHDKAAYALLPMQDVLHLGDQARMNVPGTIGDPNWQWRMNSFASFKKQIPVLRDLTIASKRID